MIGYPLSTFTEHLTKVEPQYNEKPDLTVEKFRHFIERPVDKQPEYVDSREMAGYTFDEICKVWFSRRFSSDLRKRFDPFFSETDAVPFDRFIFKISNSQWRWGMYDGDWNTLVEAYDRIRGFDFGIDGFQTNLAWTTGCNEKGYSNWQGREQKRVYLDGVFGFMVYYKGEHVLTIGFSVAKERRILINQIQLAKKTGNRWLYKLPQKHFEYVVDRMMKTFGDYFAVYLADGSWLAAAIKRSYGNSEIIPSDEVLAHVAKVYSVRMNGYKRQGRWERCGVRFHRLHRKACDESRSISTKRLESTFRRRPLAERVVACRTPSFT
jgi:hypothetical protein